MKPVSLADLSYAQGLQLLQLRKQAVDEGKVRRMSPEALANTLLLRDVGTNFVEKLAFSGLDSLKSGIKGLGQQATSALSGMDDTSKAVLRSSLLGAGLGGAAGLGKSLFTGDPNYRRNMLRGGIAGTAIGSGLGLASNSDTVANLLGKAKPEITNSSKLKGMDTTQKAKRIDELAQLAGSNSPEQELLLRAGATTAGLGGLAHGLFNRPVYDRKLLAENLSSTFAGPKAKVDSSQLSNLNRLLGREDNRARIDTLEKFLRTSRGTNFAKFLEERLPEGRSGIGKMTVPESVTRNVEGLFSTSKGKPVDALSKAMSRPGLRKLPGKAAPFLLPLLGLLEASGQGPINSYMADRAKRNSAKTELSAIQQELNDGN
jgi:hypothetical protein